MVVTNFIGYVIALFEYCTFEHVYFEKKFIHIN